MSPFDRYLHTIIETAAHEAHQDGSALIEAHHLLLAVAAEGEPATAGLLASAGLDHQAIRAALDREFEHSLAAAGVTRSAFGLPQASHKPPRPSTMGASAKLALERGFASAGRKKDLRPAHLLLGVLRAQVGTVPRALALAGVDQSELTARVEGALTEEDA